MASRGFYPPPRRGSLIGPLLLIVIGVLFLLRNFGFVVPHWTLLLRYWPLLLVLLGLLRLGEVGWARRRGSAAPRLGGGTVFFLVVLILLGLGASSILRSDLWGDRQGNWQRLFGSSYTYDGELDQTVPTNAAFALRVDNPHGDIAVKSWDQPEVRVVFHKTVLAATQREADALQQANAPRLTLSGSTLVIGGGSTDSTGSRSVATDLEIYAPPKADLEVNVRHGDVTVDVRFGQTRITAQHGDVDVEQLSGNLAASLSDGSLKVANLQGNLAVSGRLEDLTLGAIDGTANVAAEIFGDTQLSHLTHGIALRTSRTELQIARLDGTLTMDSGDLEADGASGSFILATRSKDVTLHDIQGDLQVSTDSGDITCENATPLRLGRADLTAHHGDISVKLPPQAGFQLQAVTRHGNIRSEFNAIRSQSQDQGATASGVVGHASAHFSLNSDTGDIQILKSEGVAHDETPAAPTAPAKPPKNSHAARRTQPAGDGEIY